MQIIATPASYRLLPLLYKQIVQDDSDPYKSLKKKRKEKKRKKKRIPQSVFETLESFETEHYFF